MSSENHNPDRQTATAFVRRLLQNPALSSYTPLQKEDQIIQFFHTNAGQLSPSLSTPQFFGRRSWNEILSLLVSALVELVNLDLEPAIRRMIDERLDFRFVDFLQEGSSPSDQRQIRSEVEQAVRDVVERHDARRFLVGPFTAVYYPVIERYVEEIYQRRSYIHFELTKVQRLRMGKDEVAEMVKAATLLKPAVHLISAPGASPDERSAGLIQQDYADNATKTLTKRFSSLPEPLLRTAVNANVSFQENRFIEATARLAAVLAARCRGYNPDAVVDRGADWPGKSWFATARRNYRFYGFDGKMIDELYQIAAEKGW